MSVSLQAVRGMNDLLPDLVPAWQHVEARARALLAAYGYREIRLPLVEKTELYARAVGAVTDIVEKEMYTFEDRNGDSLSLRPEGTAGCVRAGIEHGLLHNQIQRWWYAGPMFRHERPQKGRYRQFHQIGVETYGLAGPDIDAELIALCARLWRELGVDKLELQINSLGTPACRADYRRELVAYFTAHRDRLDEDSLRRLETNPLRILDSKNPDLAPLINAAPQLLAALDAESQAHFSALQAALTALGIPFTVNPRLVRGLDYYTRTVFEWVASGIGAQGTVCAGGRYDGLVGQLGGQATPAIGFAIGLERLISMLPPECLHDLSGLPHAYVIPVDGEHIPVALQVAERLRDAGVRVLLHCGGGALKNQLKKADRSGARWAVVAGVEAAGDAVAVKDLRGDDTQQTFAAADAVAHIARQLFSR